MERKRKQLIFIRKMSYSIANAHSHIKPVSVSAEMEKKLKPWWWKRKLMPFKGKKARRGRYSLKTLQWVRNSPLLRTIRIRCCVTWKERLSVDCSISVWFTWSEHVARLFDWYQTANEVITWRIYYTSKSHTKQYGPDKSLSSVAKRAKRAQFKLSMEDFHELT